MLKLIAMQITSSRDTLTGYIHVDSLPRPGAFSMDEILARFWQAPNDRMINSGTSEVIQRCFYPVRARFWPGPNMDGLTQCRSRPYVMYDVKHSRHQYMVCVEIMDGANQFKLAYG